MKPPLHKFLPAVIILFNGFIFSPFAVYTQHQQLVDSLAYAKPTERRHIFFGHIESRSDKQKNVSNRYDDKEIEIVLSKLSIKENLLNIAERGEERSREKRMYIIYVAGALVLSGIVCSCMYITMLKRERQYEKILAQNKVVTLEKEKIQDELQTARTKIDRFASKINEQRLTVEKFQHDLKKLKQLALEERKYVDGTLGGIKKLKILTNDDWFDFQRDFEKNFPVLMYGLNIGGIIKELLSLNYKKCAKSV